MFEQPEKPTPLGGDGAPVTTLRDALTGGLRALGLICWVLLETSVVLPLWPAHFSWHDPAHIGVLLIALHLLLVFAGLWSRWWRRDALVLVGLIGLAGYLLMLPMRASIDPSNYWAPGYWGLTWFVWSMIVLSRRSYLAIAWLFFPALMVVDLGWALLSGQPITRFRLAPVPWVVAPVALLCLAGDGLVRVAEDTMQRVRMRQASTEQRRREQAVAEARSEANRMLHDDVLHALHALSRPVGTVAPELAVTECRAAVYGLERSGHRPSTARLEEALANDPLIARSGLAVAGGTAELPVHVVQAMVACTHHLLRIASTSGRTGGAALAVQRDEGQWGVDIVLESPRRAQSLLPPAVGERMDDVGGEAQITGGPEGHDVIRLRWPQSQRTITEQQVSAKSNAQLRRVLLSTSWPGLVSAAVLVPLLSPIAVHPWLTALDATVVLGVGLWYLLRLRTRPLSRVDAIVLLTVSLGGWYVALALVPSTVNHVYDLWIAWASAVLLHLVALQIPPRRGVQVMIGWAALMWAGLVVRLHHVDMMRMHALVTAGVGEVTVVLVGLVVGGNLVSAHARHELLAHEARQATARLQLAGQVEHYWSQRVTGEVLPLLRAVADGRTHPGDPGVALRAQELEASLRDELTIGPGHLEVLTELASARAAGWSVAAPMLPPGAEGELDGAVPLLRLLGTPEHAGQVAKVSTSGGQPSIVVLGPGGGQVANWHRAAPDAGAVLDVDPDFVRLRPAVAAVAVTSVAAGDVPVR